MNGNDAADHPTEQVRRLRRDRAFGQPHVARMYDYFLGGKDNYAVDREAAQEVLRIFPEAPAVARANCRFLRTAVGHLVTHFGIRQFIDLGSGLPTMDNTHEVARRAAPDARVVYVDVDEVVLAHARALLSDGNTVAIGADLRRPDQVLGDPALQQLLDLDEPVAVLAVAVLHFVSDEADPAALMAAYTRRLTAGSALVISHVTDEGVQPAQVAEVQRIYQASSGPLVVRGRDAIHKLFGGWPLLGPGLVPVQDWTEHSTADRQPRKDPQHRPLLAGGPPGRARVRATAETSVGTSVDPAPLPRLPSGSASSMRARGRTQAGDGRECWAVLRSAPTRDRRRASGPLSHAVSVKNRAGRQPSSPPTP